MDLLVFPNQLFLNHPGLARKPDRVVLIEDSLFFGDSKYPLRFHKQKMWLHRATMKRFQIVLEERGFDTKYIDYDPGDCSLKRHLARLLPQTKKEQPVFEACMPEDFLLEKRLRQVCRAIGARLELIPTPLFLNTQDENREYRQGRKRWAMADFYKWQRRRLNVLMEGDQPAGGRWSYDDENRKKVKREHLSEIPRLPSLARDDVDEDARRYVEERFASHPGSLETLFYPTSHESAQQWLQDFLKHRFERFGSYEDAIVSKESWLWHSVLTPPLNIGLLVPQEVLEQTLAFASKHSIPLNSLEGFVRQVIGWREFMRATYVDLGVEMRNGNHWNHHRQLSEHFYAATTGIPPIDDTIQRVLQTGYCHHIERLMVLGGFMFLCEFHPTDIYNWFMEHFVDSYDWVMVPNVYAMSQNAEGGLITTKPYFSGSAYIRKMSNHPKGSWCETWDALYWRWIAKNADRLKSNPRWAMMCGMVKKMEPSKLARHIAIAEKYLAQLDA